jgi:hypothetical protein
VSSKTDKQLQEAMDDLFRYTPPSVDDNDIALKNIKIGDEITVDYRDFDDSIESWLT